MKICDIEKCFGCALCSAVCPKDAISINMRLGFYRPEIDLSKCINCSICVQECPANNIKNISEHKKEPYICYAAWSKDDKRHFKSASGGIASELSAQFIRTGGVVIGCIFDSDTNLIRHYIAKELSDIEKMSKSKYVLSSKEKIYDEVKGVLSKQNCLFIGTPCEIYAFKRFVSSCKEAKDVYYIDLLCHGGSSPLCFAQHIDSMKFPNIKNVTFRGGQEDCTFSVWDNEGLKYQKGQFEDEYFLAFMQHSILQPICYSCPFADYKRLGDITLGDFWGVDQMILSKSENKGLNLVMVNTEAGVSLIESVEKRIYLFERPLSEAIEGNDTLKYPTCRPEIYNKLWEKIFKRGFDKAVRIIYFKIYLEYEYNKVQYRIKCKMEPIIVKLVRLIVPGIIRKKIHQIINKKSLDPSSEMKKWEKS